MWNFLKEVVFSFHPFRYKFLSELPFRKSLAYMSKLLFLALLLSCILSVPKLFSLKSSIAAELDKFTVFDVDGNIETSAPITIPTRSPELIIDMSSNRSIGDESFLITKDNIQYRFFGKNSVSTDSVTNLMENKQAFAGFLTAILLMFIPAIVFFLYIYLWLKYFLLIFVAASVFFILLELTRWRMKWKRIANVAAHALTLPIFLEVASMPFSAKYLIPSIKFLGTYIYLIPLGIFVVFMLFGTICSHFDGLPRKRKKK